MKTSLDINKIVSYHKEENLLSEKILEILHLEFTRSLVHFPESENLLGIFYVDLFKFVSGCTLRKLELRNKIVLSDSDLWAPLKGWPYLGYSELEDTAKVNPHRFGRHFKLDEIPLKKKILSRLSHILSLPCQKKMNIAFCVDTSDKDLVLKLIQRGANVDFVTLKRSEFKIPHLEEQLEHVKKYVERVASELNPDLDMNLMFQILEKHIKGTISEGRMKDLSKYDYLILFSGAELTNRYLAASAKASKTKTVIMFHGDSFGLLDNQVHGIWEHMFADLLLGYGDAFSLNRSEYKFLNFNSVEYVPGSSEKIRSIYTGESIQNQFPAQGVFYIPTSIRGNQRRYGLNQELVDFNYLHWQKFIIDLFEGNIEVKAHPKDMFLGVVKRFLGVKVEVRNLFEMLDNIEAFVFDYVSTAFCYAAATSKPILFLDLGIQNLPASTITMLKERCHYFHVPSEGVPDLNQIRNSFKQTTKSHKLFLNYCVSEKSMDRYAELLNVIFSGEVK